MTLNHTYTQTHTYVDEFVTPHHLFCSFDLTVKVVNGRYTETCLVNYKDSEKTFTHIILIKNLGIWVINTLQVPYNNENHSFHQSFTWFRILVNAGTTSHSTTLETYA